MTMTMTMVITIINNVMTMISWRQFHWSLIYPSLLKYIQYLFTHHMCDKFNKDSDQNARNASNISVTNILQRLSTRASRIGFFKEEKSKKKNRVGYRVFVSNIGERPFAKFCDKNSVFENFSWYICKLQQKMSLFKYPIPENTRWFWKYFGSGIAKNYRVLVRHCRQAYSRIRIVKEHLAAKTCFLYY